jgi:hypothetical protein
MEKKISDYKNKLLENTSLKKMRLLRKKLNPTFLTFIMVSTVHIQVFTHLIYKIKF